MLSTMRSFGGVAIALACSGCFLADHESGNPDYPLPIFPPSLTVTEGGFTPFVVGLEGGPLPEHVGGGFFVGNTYCPGTPMQFEPCAFSLTLGDEYPAPVAAFGTRDADAMDEVIDNVDVYLFGEIGEGGHTMVVRVVDTDAPNIIASNWNVTLWPSSAAEFAVRLTQPPADTVTVTLEISANDPVDVSPASLTFSPASYDVPQTVTVRGSVAGRWAELSLAPSDGMPPRSVRLSAPLASPP
jgi:hypothetical protein